MRSVAHLIIIYPFLVRSTSGIVYPNYLPLISFCAKYGSFLLTSQVGSTRSSLSRVLPLSLLADLPIDRRSL